MNNPKLPFLTASNLALIGASLLTQASYALEPQSPQASLEEVTIIGVRDQRVSKGATNLALSLFETPQGVSVIDRATLDTFAFDDANTALKYATGVNVEEVETDRTYYNARGFDIKSMQIDGIGLPFNWNVIGDLDTAGYEKIEIVRGANGLLTGTGNPSGTINYVRKRPTNDFQASAKLSTGSWDKQRIDVDVSSPFTDTGSWAGRVVASHQEADSYLSLNSNERSFFYGVVDGQLTEKATLALGYTQQDNSSKGVLWGALPLLDSDGNQLDFPVETSTSMNWTYWDTNSKTAFIEFTYALPQDWEFKTVLTHNEYEEPSELFYVYGTPDADTGLGLYGWPGKYLSTAKQSLLDATLSGDFALGERDHKFLAGLNVSRSDNDYLSSAVPADSPAWAALPKLPGWRGNEVARPAFEPAVKAGDWDTNITRLYLATHLNATDALSFVLGVNAIDFETEGYNFGDSMDNSGSEVSPYVGATYLITETLNAYASFSDIYEPQTELNLDKKPIGAAKGDSYELGLKAEMFDQQLLASAALFRAEQENYAQYAAWDPDTGLSLYTGTDITSEGLELEASGHASENLFLSAGITLLSLEDQASEDTRTFIPRKTLSLLSRWQPSFAENLTVGVSYKWQSDIHVGEGNAEIKQADYGLLGASLSYSVNDSLTLSLNGNNLTDEKYLASLYWNQSFYGAPRNVSASLAFKM